MVLVTISVSNCSQCPHCWKHRNLYTKDETFDYFCGEYGDEPIDIGVYPDEKDVYLIPPLWCPYRTEESNVRS